MASVRPILGGGEVAEWDGKRMALEPTEFVVEGLTSTDDPLEVPGVPKERDTRTVHGVLCFCDQVGVVRKISDTAVHVRALWSNYGRFRLLAAPPEDRGDFRGFTIGYKKVRIEMPVFARGIHTYHDPDNDVVVEAPWWNRQDRPIDLEYMVLSQTVTLEELSGTDMMDCINEVRKHIGEMHIISGFEDGVYWVMQPASIVCPSEGVLQIGYVWESDPGNGTIHDPSPDPNNPTFIIPPRERPGFYTYIVQPAQSLTGDPSILVVDTFPIQFQGGILNPYYKPNGWRSLPGRPLQ